MTHTAMHLTGLQVPGFELRVAEYQPRALVSRHAHDRAVWAFIVQGQVLDETAARSDLCDPMTVRTIPAGCVHENRFGPQGARCLIIEPSSEVLRHATTAHRHPLADVRHVSAGPLSALALRLWHEVRHPDAVSAFTVECVLAEMIEHAASPELTPARGRPAWLDRVCQRLHERYREDQELADLAREAGVHPVHLVRVFRRYFGVTPADYARSLRVMFACNALRTSPNSISDIACASGFYDQSHLNRVFRRECGMTPAQYRACRRSPVTREPALRDR